MVAEKYDVKTADTPPLELVNLFAIGGGKGLKKSKI